MNSQHQGGWKGAAQAAAMASACLDVVGVVDRTARGAGCTRDSRFKSQVSREAEGQGNEEWGKWRMQNAECRIPDQKLRRKRPGSAALRRSETDRPTADVELGGFARSPEGLRGVARSGEEWRGVRNWGGNRLPCARSVVDRSGERDGSRWIKPSQTKHFFPMPGQPPPGGTRLASEAEKKRRRGMG